MSAAKDMERAVLAERRVEQALVEIDNQLRGIHHNIEATNALLEVRHALTSGR